MSFHFFFANKGDFLLNKIPSIVAISTSRKLSSNASCAMRIRRDSDDAELDVGFAGNSIDNKAIKDFGGYNLLGYTEDLSNSSWGVSSNVSITHNKSDFKGGNNASQLDFSGTGIFKQTVNILSNIYNHDKIVASIYIKGISGETVKIETRSPGDYVRQKFITFTGNWQRIDNASATVLDLGTTPSNTIFNLRRDSPNTVTSCLIYQPQVEINSTGNVTDYQPRTAGGASNCFLTTLYDQSGNRNHANQTVVINQPKVYDVLIGEVIKENGKPAMVIDGVDDHLLIPNVAGRSNIDAYFVNRHNPSLNSNNSAATRYIYPSKNIAGTYGFVVQKGSNSTTITSNYGSPNFYKNNILFAGTTRNDIYEFLGQTQNIINHRGGNVASWNSFNFGSFATNTFNFEGTLQEIIIFDRNLNTKERNLLHSDINNHFNIY
jgi:hypothetical protein